MGYCSSSHEVQKLCRLVEGLHDDDIPLLFCIKDKTSSMTLGIKRPTAFCYHDSVDGDMLCVGEMDDEIEQWGILEMNKALYILSDIKNIMISQECEMFDEETGFKIDILYGDKEVILRTII